MRKDMKDVCHETGKTSSRWDGGNKGEKRKEQKIGFENLPIRTGMSSKTKYGSVSHTPIRNFLKSRIGQKWDDVFKEVTEVLDKRSYPQKRVLEAIVGDGEWGWLVEGNVQMIDGVPHDAQGNTIPKWGGRETFYIHPETKTLEVTPAAKNNKWKYRDAKPIVKVDDLHQYHEIDGIWYLITFEKYVGQLFNNELLASCKSTGDAYYDVYFYNINTSLKKRFGAEIVPVSKQQCGKKEIRFIKEELARLEKIQKAK